MKNIPIQVLNRILAQTYGSLSHLKCNTAKRRYVYQNDTRTIGNPFVHDIKAILQSKSNRRLCGKNQVCSSPQFPHLRNRKTHTDEVAADSAMVADYLGLNVLLAQAIAFFHDNGHVPLGHQGEQFICDRFGIKFSHEIWGVGVAQHVERKGVGLNLTFETLDGMWRHSGKNAGGNMTQEAWVVRYCDKIAYLFADFNDFARVSHRCAPELTTLMDWFGENQRSRTFRTIVALCEESAMEGRVSFEKSEAAQRFNTLRTLMYQEYTKIVQQDVSSILDPICEALERSGRVPPALGLALLTDQEVYEIASIKGMLNTKHVMDTGLGEIIRLVPDEKLFAIDMCNLDLDWGKPSLVTA